MLDGSKKQVFVPVDGIVEACLDYTVGTDSYAMRIEGFDARIVIMPDGEGAQIFLNVFDRFVDEYLQLREATLNDSTVSDTDGIASSEGSV